MRGNRPIEVRGSTDDICKCIQNTIPLWFPPTESVIEQINVGHLCWETVDRILHEDGARRVECNPYLGRTVDEMRTSGCRIVDPLSQVCPHRLIAIY